MTPGTATRWAVFKISLPCAKRAFFGRDRAFLLVPQLVS